MQIGNRKIGSGYPPLIIAEIGINHEGSLDTAIDMVNAAINAGAEVIKHQTHIVDDEMSPLAKRVIPGNANESIYDIMKRCSLSEEDERYLKEYIESNGLIFISTPFSRSAANRLESMDVQAYKIGSGECNNLPLIEHVASFGKPMIISTGMNNIESIEQTVAIVKRHNIDYALLHCTNLYPTKPEFIRLGAMVELMEHFPDIPIGLSDHSLNNNACLAATALGACILERHFTDSKYRLGPDILCSMDTSELSTLIQSANEIYLMRGGKKEALLQEKVTIDFAFATLVAIEDIREGDVFTIKNTWVKRPGIGEIKAARYNECLGKTATRFIKEGEHIKLSDLK